MIYLGTFFYEDLLRENNLINDRKNTIGGVVPYPAWEIYMLAGLSKLNVDEVAAKIKGIKSATWDLLLLSKIIDPKSIDDEDNIKLVRRYLPNAYIRSKATVLGTLVLSRGISAFDPWGDAVILGMQGDESGKVNPYLPEEFKRHSALLARNALSRRSRHRTPCNLLPPRIEISESLYSSEPSSSLLCFWCRLSLLVLAPSPQHLH